MEWTELTEIKDMIEYLRKHPTRDGRIVRSISMYRLPGRLWDIFLLVLEAPGVWDRFHIEAWTHIQFFCNQHRVPVWRVGRSGAWLQLINDHAWQEIRHKYFLDEYDEYADDEREELDDLIRKAYHLLWNFDQAVDNYIASWVAQLEAFQRLPEEIRSFILVFQPCREAMRWLEKVPTLREAWEICPSEDWQWWLLEHELLDIADDYYEPSEVDVDYLLEKVNRRIKSTV